jgi:hypothetical protein
MSAEDLKLFKRQFESLKRKFNKPHHRWEPWEDLWARKRAAISGMEALLAKAADRGEEGQALEGEIQAFLAEHKNPFPVGPLMAAAGKWKKGEAAKGEEEEGHSLADWISDRGGRTFVGPSTARRNDRARDKPRGPLSPLGKVMKTPKK